MLTEHKPKQKSSKLSTRAVLRSDTDALNASLGTHANRVAAPNNKQQKQF